jgi:branched-chain amino acid transport system ATP-binding protein
MATILEAKRVTKRFGDLAAINDLSFEVEEGQIFGIAGPNGAGKTTLFNLISGIYSGAGEINFKGQRISGLRPYRICRKGVSRTFQVPTVFATLSVYDNLRVGAHFGGHRGDEKENILHVLEFVGLAHRKDVQAKHLPLFEKKLTMLGVALATHPSLLMLDEPIGGLIPIEIDESVKLFRRINQELGVTLIIIEHLMKVLMGMANRMMILHNGQEICIGSPEAVARDPQVIEVYLGADYARS